MKAYISRLSSSREIDALRVTSRGSVTKLVKGKDGIEDSFKILGRGTYLIEIDWECPLPKQSFVYEYKG